MRVVGPNRIVRRLAMAACWSSGNVQRPVQQVDRGSCGVLSVAGPAGRPSDKHRQQAFKHMWRGLRQEVEKSSPTHPPAPARPSHCIGSRAEAGRKLTGAPPSWAAIAACRTKPFAMQEVGGCKVRVGRECRVGTRADGFGRFRAHIVVEISKGMPIVIACQDELLHPQVGINGPDLRPLGFALGGPERARSRDRGEASRAMCAQPGS